MGNPGKGVLKVKMSKMYCKQHKYGSRRMFHNNNYTNTSTFITTLLTEYNHETIIQWNL